jgi:preprotein translocase subunit SecF
VPYDAKQGSLAVIASAVLALVALVLLFIPGLERSVDLWSGTMLEVQFKEAVDEGRLLSGMDAAGFHDVSTLWLPSMDKMGLAVVGDENPERVRAETQSVLDRVSPGAVVNQVRPVSAPAARHIVYGSLIAVALVFVCGALWTWFRFGAPFAAALVSGQVLNAVQVLGICALGRTPFGVTGIWAVVLVLLVSFAGANTVFYRAAGEARAPQSAGLAAAIERAVKSMRLWVYGISGVSLAIAPTPLALWLASAAALLLAALSSLYVVPALLLVASRPGPRQRARRLSSANAL